MKTRFITSWILGLIGCFSNAVIANAVEMEDHEQPSIDQVQQYTSNAANNLSEVIDLIISISPENHTYENSIKLRNVFFEELSEVFHTLTTISDSHLSSSHIASQSIEDFNRFLIEAMNYPPFHQKLLEFSQGILSGDESDLFQRSIASNLIQNQWQEIAGLYAYPQGKLNTFNNFIAKSSDKDNDKGDRGYELGGGATARWGDGKGITWEGYFKGEAHDGKGNYVEGKISQKDDGTGRVDVYGGHENYDE